MQDKGYEQWLVNGRVRADMVLVVVRSIDGETRFFEPINGNCPYSRATDGVGEIVEIPLNLGESTRVTRKIAGRTEVVFIRNENGQAKCQNIPALV